MRTLTVVRLLALAGFAWFFASLAAALAQTWDTFSPSYWGHYVQQELARPLAGLAVSALLLAAARPLARWLDRP
jgi:nitrate reductase alpha subunit